MKKAHDDLDGVLFPWTAGALTVTIYPNSFLPFYIPNLNLYILVYFFIFFLFCPFIPNFAQDTQPCCMPLFAYHILVIAKFLKRLKAFVICILSCIDLEHLPNLLRNPLPFDFALSFGGCPDLILWRLKLCIC